MVKNKIIYLFLLSVLMFSAFTNTAAAQDKKKKKNSKENTAAPVVKVTEQMKVQADRLCIDGVTQKNLGNFNEAFNLFSQSVSINPSIDAAYFEMANIQLLKSDYARATANIEKAIKLSPQNAYYREYYGELLAAQYKFADAAKVFGELKNQYPDRFIYYYDYAYFLGKDKKYAEALKVYNEIESKLGVQEEAAMQKHKIYIQQNKIDEAVNELTKLIDLFPEEDSYKHMLAEFYMVNGKEDLAVKYYEEILKNNPNDPIAITSLADYYKLKGDRDKYIGYYKSAFSNTNIPLDAKVMVLYNYIQYYDEVKGEISDAFELADLLKQAHPNDAKVYAITGDLYNLNNQTEKALENYLQSLELQKDIFSVWQQVFFIYSDKKEYQKLADITNEAQEYFVSQPIVYFFNGIAHHQLKEYEKAEKSYSKAVKMAADNLPLKAQLYSNLGDVYNSLKKYKESDESFESALTIEPENAYTLNNYSYYLSLRNENLDRAKEMSAKANKLVPQNSSFLDTHAWVLYKKGEYTEALNFQKKAIDVSEEPSSTLYEHYGDILFKLGRVEEAVTFWKKAMDNEPEDKINLSKKIADKKLYE
jgi:tetratricopeptide (TPR) repeat protein